MESHTQTVSRTEQSQITMQTIYNIASCLLQFVYQLKFIAVSLLNSWTHRYAECVWVCVWRQVLIWDVLCRHIYFLAYIYFINISPQYTNLPRLFVLTSSKDVFTKDGTVFSLKTKKLHKMDFSHNLTKKVNKMDCFSIQISCTESQYLLHESLLKFFLVLNRNFKINEYKFNFYPWI